MKLPVTKEVNGKRMTMTSGTSTERKGLICERRESSLVAGHGIGGVQFKANMDLGSGDTSEYYTRLQSNYESFNWDPRFESHDFHSAESTITSISVTPPQLPSPATPGVHTLSSSSESISNQTSKDNFGDDKSNADNFFKETGNRSSESKNATLAIVEDSKQPNFTANESNPTVPAPTEPTKTSTLRLSDRTRSEKLMERRRKIRMARAIFFKSFQESEDDIEKMDEPEQDGTLLGHKPLCKTTATTENSPNSDKMDKNGNRSDFGQSESENDCVVQCLYYTIQCCECVIS